MQGNEGSDSSGNETDEASGVARDHEGPRHSDGSRPAQFANKRKKVNENDDREILMGSDRAVDSRSGRSRESGQPIDFKDAKVIASLVAEHHSGPMPSSKELRAYKQIDSSLPNRMMTMAEKQQDANIRIAERLSKSEAFSVSIVAVCAAVLPWVICAFCIWQGDAIPAWISGGAGFVTASAQLIRSIRGEAHSDDKEESGSK